MNQKENHDIDFFRVGVFTKYAKNIGIITYNGNIDVTAKEMELFCEYIYGVMNNEPFYLINEVKEIGVFAADVWEFFGTNILHNNAIIASAVTSNSLGYKMQTSFYFKQYPLKYPVQLFENKSLALEWIEGLIIAR